MDKLERLSALLKEVPELINLALDSGAEFNASLNSIERILKEELHIDKAKTQDDLDAFEGSIRRKCITILKQAGRHLKKMLSRGKDLLKCLKEISGIVGPKYSKDIDAFMLVLSDSFINLKSSFGKGRAIKKNLTYLDRSVAMSEISNVWPNIAAMKQEYLAIADYFKKNSSQLVIDVEDNMKLTIDFSSGFQVRNVRYVIIDAQFARSLFEAKKAAKKERYAIINLPKAEFVVPKEVVSEMEKKSYSGFGTPLVPDDLRNYLFRILGAKVIDVHPTDSERQQVVSNWWGTSKARHASEYEANKFHRHSGDMAILSFCVRNENRGVAILSGDSEIRHVVERFRRNEDRMKNVSVFALKSGNIERLT